MQKRTTFTFLLCVLLSSFAYSNGDTLFNVGPRPAALIDKLPTGPLKQKLRSCQAKEIVRSDFSIGHRGAPLQFPEHTKESYVAAARMGAGILECDVTFTKDLELVCRHAQCDLHDTTDILLKPELAAKCSQPFIPADLKSNTPAQVQCCTSDITLAEFKQLKGKMDGGNKQATTPLEYTQGTPGWRTDLYQTHGTLMTHAESITLFKSLGVKMTPELKTPQVDMPFSGLTQKRLANKMIREYKQQQVPPRLVYPQSFNLGDLKIWQKNKPRYAKRAVYLDGRSLNEDFHPDKPSTWSPSMQTLKSQGVKILAPPTWMLLSLDQDKKIVPSQYALAAKEAGFELITWTLERSGDLSDGGGWYYQTISEAIQDDGDIFTVLDVLAQQIGVIGVFSDWPATTSYYASCLELGVKK